MLLLLVTCNLKNALVRIPKKPRRRRCISHFSQFWHVFLRMKREKLYIGSGRENQANLSEAGASSRKVLYFFRGDTPLIPPLAWALSLAHSLSSPALLHALTNYRSQLVDTWMILVRISNFLRSFSEKNVSWGGYKLTKSYELLRYNIENGIEWHSFYLVAWDAL